MRRRTAALDPGRPRTPRHRGPAWIVEAVHLQGHADPVAAKRPHRPGFHADTLLAAEADVARSARHDRLVRAVGRIELDGAPALCLAPCALGSVEALVTRPAPPAAVAGLVSDVGGALGALHAAGWVHGRVDGSHVLVGPDGRAVLAGLGRARATPASSPPGDAVEGPTPADDVADLARLAGSLLDPSGADPEGVGLRSVLRRMDDADPGRRPTAATAAELAVRFGPPPAPLAAVDDHRDGSGAAPGTSDGEGSSGLARPPTSRWRWSLPRSRRPWRHPRRAGAVALAVAGIACGLLGGQAVLGASAPAPAPAAVPPCPVDGAPAASPTAEVAAVDVDGRGCTVDVRWSAATGVIEVVTPDGLRRYALGGPGDRLVLGDWDCDGATTPLLVRPGSATGWRFDGWPQDGEPVDGAPVPLDGVGGAPRPPHCP